jgi:hypothetical protein
MIVSEAKFMFHLFDIFDGKTTESCKFEIDTEDWSEEHFAVLDRSENFKVVILSKTPEYRFVHEDGFKYTWYGYKSDRRFMLNRMTSIINKHRIDGIRYSIGR